MEVEEETEKWRKKLESLKIVALTEEGKWMLENIEAYLSDSKYFKGLRAFEAVIWAWAFFEIGLELGHLKAEKKY
ncbi:MAG: DUF357 domain-containing protein [Candidatus Micrarchaeota archaeon]|nr:DUF357 domain-containing protein [Candidatus Micrarchaeota archaeon]